MRTLFTFTPESAGFGPLGHSALVTSGGVLVDQPLAGGAIEQARRCQLRISGRVSRASRLEDRPQSCTLRSVADVGRARLAHVLLCGIDLGHVELSKKTRKKWLDS